MIDRRILRRHPFALAWASVGAMVICWLVFSVLGDRVWWALPMLYGPRWVYAIFIAGTLPLWIAQPRRAWLPTLCAVAILLFGFLDFRLGVGRLARLGGTTLRVLTLNADGPRGIANPELDRVRDQIDRDRPDVVVVTECSDDLLHVMQQIAGYHARRARKFNLCFASDDTVLTWEERDPQAAWIASGSGEIARATVHPSGGRTWMIGMVHLATPRAALERFRWWRKIPTLRPAVTSNRVERETESSEAAAWIMRDDTLPTVIAGDFNLPIESAVYRKYWSPFTDAFSAVGWGTGYTKHTSWWGIRIDHILLAQGARPRRAFVGADVGSDHLPLIADVVAPDQ